MSFLLLEDGSKLLQEDGSGILLDITDFFDDGQLDLGAMVAFLSTDLGSFPTVLQHDIGSLISIVSINLNEFKVLQDG